MSPGHTANTCPRSQTDSRRRRQHLFTWVYALTRSCCGQRTNIFVLYVGVLIVWSPKDVDAGVWASLLQIYPVLLSTLSSINRKQLSLFDASFALVLCSSPFTVYLVAISICKLCGVATCLYKRVKSCHLISLLGALVAILWFGLSMTLRLSDHAFIDSNLCKGSTFKDWLWDLSDLCSKVLAPGALGPPAVILFAVPFDLLLLRRWHQVKKEFLTGLEGRSKLWVWSTAPLRFVRCAWWVFIALDCR